MGAVERGTLFTTIPLELPTARSVARSFPGGIDMSGMRGEGDKEVRFPTIDLFISFFHYNRS